LPRLKSSCEKDFVPVLASLEHRNFIHDLETREAYPVNVVMTAQLAHARDSVAGPDAKVGEPARGGKDLRLQMMKGRVSDLVHRALLEFVAKPTEERYGCRQQDQPRANFGQPVSTFRPDQERQQRNHDK